MNKNPYITCNLKFDYNLLVEHHRHTYFLNIHIKKLINKNH